MEEERTLSARGTFRQRAIYVFWLVLLVLLGSGTVWQLYRLLPGWIEDSVERTLLDKGVVVTAFPVDQVGIGKTIIGSGGLVRDSHALNWDSIRVEYHLKDIIEGRVGNVLLDAPLLRLQLPDPTERLLADTASTSPDSTDLDLPGEPVPEITQWVLEDVPTAQEDPTVEPVPPPVPELPAGTSLWQQLQDLALGSLEAPGGVLDIQLQEETILSMEMEGRMEKQPFGTSGELFIANDLLSAHISIRAPATNPVVTLQGELAMPPGGLKGIAAQGATFASALEWVPQILSSGQVSSDFLVEMDGGGLPYGSAELSIDELTLQFAQFPAEFTLNELILAGAYKDQQLTFDSGAELLIPERDRLRIEPFGLKVSLEPDAGIVLESESFAWDAWGLSGKSALRGSANLEEKVARVEVAFSKIVAKWFNLEPCSLLLESSGDEVLAKASPVGVKKVDTLWVEDLKSVLNTGNRSVEGGLTWYNPFGVHMGMMGFTASGIGAPTLEARALLSEPGKAPFLSAKLEKTGPITRYTADGMALLSWVNSLKAWWGGAPVTLKGGNPLLKIELSGIHPVYSGTIDLGLPSLSVELGGGKRINGIEGDISLSVQGVPQTTGAQQLRIKSFTSGQFALNDIFLEWGLPNVRQFQVKQFQARIGSGKLGLDPFVLDPFKPVVKTRLRVENLEGNKLLEWLNEKRFSIVGTVSGQLALGWDNGTFILGGGTFKLDSGIQDGRFVFSDPSFLKERFGTLGGVPQDLRERFLQALQEEGILIHSMEASLGPASESGKILLRMAISGETKSERLEMPIKGFVINNVISGEDLGRLLGLIGPVRFDASE